MREIESACRNFRFHFTGVDHVLSAQDILNIAVADSIGISENLNDRFAEPGGYLKGNFDHIGGYDFCVYEETAYLLVVFAGNCHLNYLFE